MAFNIFSKALFCAFLLTGLLNGILGQQFFRKPWPTYSLQNMPETRFTCHDKILGGYYADPETQCQMFHVCVKVAGVGVQDFRFLCPNGTAFDQEAQICADWGDVDCDQSVLYYGSDNFDLYRIGSGYESKKAPLAEEEESTFHLQRAESGDIRRSKEKRIDQKSRPDEPPNYTRRFESTPRNDFNNFAYTEKKSNSNRNQLNYEEKKRPIVSYYTPVKSTTTTTTERYTDDSKQDFEEIFKGSHSSNFFANRNGGREDDFLDHPIKTKLNDFSDYSKKSETSTTGKSRVPTTKRVQHTTSTSSTTTTTTTTTLKPKTTKKLISQTTFQSDPFNLAYLPKSTTVRPPTISTTTTSRPIPHRSQQANSNKYSFPLGDIQPTTYNPSNSIYKLKLTTPKSLTLNGDNEVYRNGPKSSTIEKTKPTASVSRKSQKQKLGPRNSTFVNHNEFDEFTKIKVQQPQPFQPVKTTSAPKTYQNVEPQQFRSRSQTAKQARVGFEEPAPFSSPQKEKPASSHRGSVNRGSINYKATTLQYNSPSSAAPTPSNGGKKFSTLVPRDSYTPTTFKPTTYQKANEYNYYLTQQTVKPNNKVQKQPTVVSTTALPTTANPYYNPDEDDGQYHPELYELDFHRNRFNLQRSSTTTTTAPTTTLKATTSRKPSASHNFQNPQTHLKTQQQTSFLKQQQQQQQQNQGSDSSDEDELFKTAQSLNFGAASINKLRADIYKAEKTSQQYNSQYSPNVPFTSTSSPATVRTSQYTTKSPDYYGFQTSSTTPRYITSTFAPTTAVYTTPSTTRPTTRRPVTTSTATTPQAFNYDVTKSGKKPSKSKNKKTNNKVSKRPPHADEDTSYDYAYYDSDTLSESPQDYPEYAIAEFSKTRKN